MYLNTKENRTKPVFLFWLENVLIEKDVEWVHCLSDNEISLCGYRDYIISKQNIITQQNVYYRNTESK